MIKGSLVIFKGVKKNGIFVTRVILIFENAATVTSAKPDSTLKLHKRLAHVSEKCLIILHKRGAFGKDLISKIHFCENCTLEKHYKLHFDSGKYKNTSLLEYFHFDLWDPASTTTQGGNKYFLSIIDGFSRNVSIFFNIYRSKTFEKFKNLKVLIENQMAVKINVLKTDNDLESCNFEFNLLCEKMVN